MSSWKIGWMDGITTSVVSSTTAVSGVYDVLDND